MSYDFLISIFFDNLLLISYFSVGEITNFMSTDLSKIVDSGPVLHLFWSIPFEVRVTSHIDRDLSKGRIRDKSPF